MGITNVDALTTTGNAVVGGTLAVTGAITATGGVVGNVTGNVSGTAGSATGNAATATLATDAAPVAPQVISGDGAITIPATGRYAQVFLTKGSAAAITLAAPAAGTDDGKEILVYSESAQAHQVTCSTVGFNAKGSSGTMTNAVAADNYFKVVARNGHWRVISNVGYTKA